MKTNKLTKKSTKIAIISVASVFLSVLLVLSGIGVYFLFKKDTPTPPEVIVNPIEFSVDAWDGSAVSKAEYHTSYAGRSANTTTIDSAQSFVYFVQQANAGETFEGKTVYLNRSIDLKGFTINSIKNFKGTFDGGYYNLLNANINGNALFEQTEGATIKNIGLYNCTVNGVERGAGLISKAVNTNIENVFVRLGEIKGTVTSGLVSEFVSNNGEDNHVTNSFVDAGQLTYGLIGSVNTNGNSSNTVWVENCYYTNATEASPVTTEYLEFANVLKPTSLNDFSSWGYSESYLDGEKWCNYSFMANSNELSFNYPVQSNFVKVYNTGSGYESVVKVGETTVDATNLSQAVAVVASNENAEINFIVEKVFVEEEARVNSNSTVIISSMKNTAIQRGNNNTGSLISATAEGSKVVIGANVSTVAQTSTSSAENSIVLDGNADYVKANNLSSGALITAYDNNVEIAANVTLQNNVNTQTAGGAILVYGTTEDAEVEYSNLNIENCTSTVSGGGAICAIDTDLNLSNVTISNVTSNGNGGAIYVASSTEEPETISHLSSTYGIKNISKLGTSSGRVTDTHATLTDVTITNASGTEGGAINVTGSANLTNCTISHCTADYAAAIYTRYGITLTNTIISKNTANKGYGAIYNYQGPPSITGSIFAENKTLAGAPCLIYVSYYYAEPGYFPEYYSTIKDTTFIGNSTTTTQTNGSMLDIRCNVTLQGCKFINNNFGSNNLIPAVASDETIVEDTTFEGNTCLSLIIVHNSATLTLKNSTLKDATLSHSALYLTSHSSATVQDCTFQGLSSTNKGAAVLLWRADATFTNCNFINNKSTHYGGAICASTDESEKDSYSTLSISKCNFTGNSSDAHGGAVYTEWAETKYINLQISDSIFTNNTAKYRGAAIHASFIKVYRTQFTNHSITNEVLNVNGKNAPYVPLVSDCTFYNNSTDTSALIFSNTSSVHFENCKFINNKSGIIIHSNNTSSFKIKDCFFDSNTVSNIINSVGPTPDISDSTFKNSTLTDSIFAMSSNEYTVEGCTFEGNTSSSSGTIERITGSSDKTYKDCYFTNNSTTGNGAVLNVIAGQCTIDNCKFTGNTATGRGGSIYTGGGTLTVSNSIFSGNTAGSYGSAIAVFETGTLDVTDSTFVSNTAANGTIYLNGGDSNVTGCTFKDNCSRDMGSAVSHNNGTSNVTDCSFVENYTTAYAYSVYSTSSITLNESIFKDNQQGDFYGHNSAIVTSCTFSGSTGTSGAAVRFETTTTGVISDCIFVDVVAEHALYLNGVMQAVEFVTFKDCKTAIVCYKARTSASSSVKTTIYNIIIGNAAYGVMNYDGNNIENSTFTNLRSAAISLSSSSCTVTNSTISNCTTAVVGATSGSSLVMDNCEVVNNTNTTADVELIEVNGSVTIKNSNISNNSVNGDLILNGMNSTLTVENTEFDENTCGSVIHVNNYVTGSFKTSTISNSTLTKSAVLLYTGCSLTFEDSYFTNNSATYSGTAIRLWRSEATITNCHFIDNSTTNTGGAISAEIDGSSTYYELTVENSTFVNNSSANYGGAIYTAGSTKDQYGQTTYINLTVRNCTFDANSANDGAAIYASGIIAYDSTFTHHTTNMICITDTGYRYSLTLYRCNLNYNNVGSENLIYAAQGTHDIYLYDCIISYNTTTNILIRAAGIDYTDIYNTVFDHNTASYILSPSHMNTCSITGSTFSYSTLTGSVINFGFASSSTFSDSNFVNNHTTGESAFASCINHVSSGELTLRNCNFSGNSSDTHGGAINVKSASLNLVNCNFTGNSTANHGGAINADDGSTLTVNNSTFTNNSSTGSSYGGAIYIIGSTTNLTVTNSDFTANTAGGTGGAIHCQTATITGSNFNQNTVSDNAGAIRCEGNLTIDSSTFNGNTAVSDVGAISCGGNLIIRNNTIISNNSAGERCGGAFAEGTLTVTNSKINDNTSANGGALFSTGNMTLTDSEIYNNAGTTDGGAVVAGYSLGIYSYTPTLTINNTKIHNNSTPGDGGGVAAFGKLYISNPGLVYNNYAGGDGSDILLFRSNYIQYTGSTLTAAPVGQTSSVYYGSSVLGVSHAKAGNTAASTTSSANAAIAIGSIYVENDVNTGVSGSNVVFIADGYAVTINPNGGKIGYTANGSTSSLSTSNLTLYASYNSTKLYKENTLSNEVTAITVTKNGYTYLGLFDAQTNGAQVIGATSAQFTRPYNLTTTATYYAQYSVNHYSISYNLNGGVLAANNRTSYTVEDTFTLNNPTKEGYTFLGWNNGSSTSANVTIAKGTTGDKSYTAEFAESTIQHTFTISANNATYGTVSQSSLVITTALNGTYSVIQKGNVIDINGTEITATAKAGYVFTRWSLASNNANHTTTVIAEFSPAVTITITATGATANNTYGVIVCDENWNELARYTSTFYVAQGSKYILKVFATLDSNTLTNAHQILNISANDSVFVTTNSKETSYRDATYINATTNGITENVTVNFAYTSAYYMEVEHTINNVINGLTSLTSSAGTTYKVGEGYVIPKGGKVTFVIDSTMLPGLDKSYFYTRLTFKTATGEYTQGAVETNATYLTGSANGNIYTYTTKETSFEISKLTIKVVAQSIEIDAGELEWKPEVEEGQIDNITSITIVSDDGHVKTLGPDSGKVILYSSKWTITHVNGEASAAISESTLKLIFNKYTSYTNFKTGSEDGIPYVLIVSE